MDITQELKNTENSLRDFIFLFLEKHHGINWLKESGVPETRIQIWKDRKIVEEKRQVTGSVEERILYYADFYDLKTILKKNWPIFAEVFGDWKVMDIWLSELEKLRDPDAHRRELLPHQKHLIMGISGEIRTKLIKFRSKIETSEDVFPRIESARDNLGNIIINGYNKSNKKVVLRPGDIIEFVITASDPLGSDIEYGMTVTGHHHNPVWQQENSFALLLEPKHVGKTFGVMFWIKSSREFHANSGYDDSVTFHYDVLPPQK